MLEALQSAERYNRWLAELTLHWLGDDPLEVGSGIGTNASLWLELGLARLTVSEQSRTGEARLRERFAGDERVAVATVDLSDAGAGDYSSVTALNVLEHIEDDVGALRSAGRLVRPGGRVVMFVPAFPFAAGRFDRSIGHHRRYTRASLAAAYTEAGLVVESTRYVNAPGLLAWTLLVRVLGREPADGPALRLWDRAVIPVVRRVESLRPPPAGQSLLAVGRAAG